MLNRAGNPALFHGLWSSKTYSVILADSIQFVLHPTICILAQHLQFTQNDDCRFIPPRSFYFRFRGILIMSPTVSSYTSSINVEIGWTISFSRLRASFSPSILVVPRRNVLEIQPSGIIKNFIFRKNQFPKSRSHCPGLPFPAFQSDADIWY